MLQTWCPGNPAHEKDRWLAHQILIFDSGVGGLSIYREIVARMPTLKIAYASDNGFFPYGLKGEQELLARVETVLRELVGRWTPDVIVVACNTASTVVLPHIRTHFKMPVIGVVPAIKPAAQITQNKIIGLLATPGTVQRAYTKQLIDHYAADCHVISVGSSELVQMVESWMAGATLDEAHLQKILSPFFDSGGAAPDTIVLGCTHFPLIKEMLQRVVTTPVNWVDSGKAIANRLQEVLVSLPPHVHAPEAQPHNVAFFTEDNSSARAMVPVLSKMGFGAVEWLTLSMS